MAGLAKARVYTYKVPRTSVGKPPKARLAVPQAEAPVTGFINGVAASALEERFARALGRMGVPFQFQVPITTAHNLPYEKKQVDFMVGDPPIHPLEIDGAFAHKSAEAKATDRLRDVEIDSVLGPYGYSPVKRLDGELCQTQAGADLLAQDNLP